MLIPRMAQREPLVRQGSPRVSFAELRRNLTRPAFVSGGHRQRLLELAQRLSRVQALGDEYARVDFSDSVRALLQGDRVGE